MSINKKILESVLRGKSDNNIRFEDICNLLIALDFSNRIKGNHHIFYRDGIEEILNLQPKDSKSKPYQVKQVRNLIQKYHLVGENDE